MAVACGHRLCELLGGACSLVVVRSRGCRPNLLPREVAAETFDEIGELVAVVDPPGGQPAADERWRAAAVRLAQIIRRESLDGRNLVAIARADELEFAGALTKLCGRQR